MNKWISETSHSNLIGDMGGGETQQQQQQQQQ